MRRRRRRCPLWRVLLQRRVPLRHLRLLLLRPRPLQRLPLHRLLKSNLDKEAHELIASLPPSLAILLPCLLPRCCCSRCVQCSHPLFHTLSSLSKFDDVSSRTLAPDRAFILRSLSLLSTSTLAPLSASTTLLSLYPSISIVELDSAVAMAHISLSSFLLPSLFLSPPTHTLFGCFVCEFLLAAVFVLLLVQLLIHSWTCSCSCCNTSSAADAATETCLALRLQSCGARRPCACWTHERSVLRRTVQHLTFSNSCPPAGALLQQNLRWGVTDGRPVPDRSQTDASVLVGDAMYTNGRTHPHPRVPPDHLVGTTRAPQTTKTGFHLLTLHSVPRRDSIAFENFASRPRGQLWASSNTLAPWPSPAIGQCGPRPLPTRHKSR